ncbi:HAAS signaling domain-containing protein [Haloactinospora alba]|nr:hypothetical protein [Haloactinospora alba]
MSERAEQLVLSYLSRVGDAAYGALSPRHRASYLAGLRSRIEAACIGGKATRVEDVRRVLEEFGDPAELVSRECATEAVPGPPGGPGAAVTPEEESQPENPRRVRRDPPPWRGGPDGGWLGRGGAFGRPSEGIAPGRALGDLARAARRNPPELLALLLYLASAAGSALAAVWLLGAALAALSRVWTRRDKWVALGVPVAATALGMLLWPGEAPYIDQVLLGSLADTGVYGLRAAAVCVAFYLAARTSRITREAAD